MENKKPLGDAYSSGTDTASFNATGAPSRGRLIGFFVAAVFLILTAIAAIWFTILSNQQSGFNSQFNNTNLDLNNIAQSDFIDTEELSILGQLNINGAFVLKPSPQPSSPDPGQFYYDQTTNVLSYYNGIQFVKLTGDSTVGSGLTSVDGLLTNSGVLSLQGQTGDVTLTAGSGISINGTTISATSGGASGVGGSGTAGKIVKFTGAQTIGNSLLSESGATVSISGGLSLSGDISFNGAGAVGTSNASPLSFETNNTTRISIGSTGDITIGTSDTTGALLFLDIKTSSGDPAGTAAAMYYNSNLGQFRCYEVDHWRDCVESARTSYHYINDMITLASGETDFVSSGGGIATRNAKAGHPGIVYFDTGTSGPGTWLWGVPRSSAAEVVLLGNGDVWRYQTLTQLISGGNALSDGTDRYTVRHGFIDDATINNGDGNDGCFFRYSDNINSGIWQGVCRDNTTESTCDTTIAVALDTWYRLTLEVNSAGNSADFQIDGVSKCQVTTNIPTASNRTTNWGASLYKNLGTTSRTMDIDYLDVSSQFGTPR